MKYTNKLIGTMLLAVTALTSCVDDDKLEYSYEKPASIAGYEYLNDYAPLKTYKNAKAAPDFKLGVALAAADYNADGLVTRLANSNFDEVVAGNAMKMASCVNDKGEMDFGTVANFVSNATENGMKVYGHTLAWHAQQPVKWLNKLIADKVIEVDPNEMVDKEVLTNDFTTATSYTAGWGSELATQAMSFNGALTITLAEPTPNFYDIQYMVASGFSLIGGKDHRLIVTMKASADGEMHFKIGDWGSSVKEGTFSFTTEMKDIEIPFTPSADISGQFVLFQSGDFVGTYDIYSVKIVYRDAAGPATYFASLISNGDMEGDDAHNFASKENAGSTVYQIYDGVGVGGSRGVKIDAKGGQPDAWESQFWIVSDEVLHIGDVVHVAFDYRAEGGCVGTGVDTQAHFGPGEYQHYQCAGTVNFTDAWQTYDKTFTVDASMATAEDKGMKSIAFNMSPNATDGTYFIDNVVLEIEKAGDGIPLTPEEKIDTLTWAMEQWISGMMEACEGKVKAWDVVNEAISGADADGDGYYDLQHGSEENTTDFFWQDHMGDALYVQTAVRLARQYGPEGVTLFVNDYNLESDWDGNKKLESLIHWIGVWESDGVTKIDGIGSQMHISCYADPTVQESKKNGIENMLTMMVQSGKLVRISELDMGYIDADGNEVATAKLTEAQHKEMAALYTWIIKKYFEIVPAAQQWGICQWCITDSPADSGWRPNTPTGLWDQNYNRKHTYAGFADGLQGK